MHLSVSSSYFPNTTLECVASIESHSERHCFTEQQEIWIQEFSVIQVGIFRLPRPLSFVQLSLLQRPCLSYLGIAVTSGRDWHTPEDHDMLLLAHLPGRG